MGVFDSSTCLSNMDDAIETIDTAAKLVSYNHHKILKLVTISESIENEKDTIKLLRSSGDIFRILNDLLPEFKEEPIRQCRASPGDILEDMAELFADLGSKEQAQIFRLRGDYVKKSV